MDSVARLKKNFEVKTLPLNRPLLIDLPLRVAVGQFCSCSVRFCLEETSMVSKRRKKKKEVPLISQKCSQAVACR